MRAPWACSLSSRSLLIDDNLLSAAMTIGAQPLRELMGSNLLFLYRDRAASPLESHGQLSQALSQNG